MASKNIMVLHIIHNIIYYSILLYEFQRILNILVVNNNFLNRKKILKVLKIKFSTRVSNGLVKVL
jgi:hypothetical protein